MKASFVRLYLLVNSIYLWPAAIIPLVIPLIVCWYDVFIVYRGNTRDVNAVCRIILNKTVLHTVPSVCLNTIYMPNTRINSLWLNAAICRHRSGPMLAQVIARCLTAPSHCINQSFVAYLTTILHETLKISVHQISLKIPFVPGHIKFKNDDLNTGSPFY